MHTKIYFDHNSTTQPSPSVVAYFKNKFGQLYANPSSEHLLGAESDDIMQADRDKIASTLGVNKQSLVFNSGATEGINTVLSLENLKAHSISTIISSKLEHHATLSALKRAEKAGVKIAWLSNDENGHIKYREGELASLVKAGERALLTLLCVNNETGVILDAESIAKEARDQNILTHFDCAQLVGKSKFDLEKMDPDFATFSGHKFGAIKGVGFLYVKHPKSLAPFIVGGGQERGLRAGTTNFDGIRSIRFALEDVSLENMKRTQALRDYFEAKIKNIPNAYINCANAVRCANTSSVHIAGLPNDAALMALSQAGVAVSTGSACVSGSTEPSHVIQELGHSKQYAASCIRFSFSHTNTELEIDYATQKIAEILSKNYSAQLNSRNSTPANVLPEKTSGRTKQI